MSTKTLPMTVGYVRQHARHSMAEQRRLMALHGVAKIYTDLDLCVRQRRVGNGDVVAVKRLMLLADPKRLRTRGGLRQSMREAIEAIEAAGSTVVELDTGRRRDDKSVSEAMLLDAIDELSRSRAHTRPTGRPRRQWSIEQLAVMRLHWRSLEHATNRDAVAAMVKDGVRVSASQVYKALGKSGRELGPKI